MAAVVAVCVSVCGVVQAAIASTDAAMSERFM